MTDEDLQKFSDELNDLAKKYGIYHISFCGMINKADEKQFVGLVGNDYKDAFDFAHAILLVGRLWQSAREKMIQTLNIAEKRIH